jgi:hypothetical protein
MNQFSQLQSEDSLSTEQVIKYRQPFVLSSKSSSFLSSYTESSGSYSDVFGKHIILGLRNSFSSTPSSVIELPMKNVVTIFSGNSRLLCNVGIQSPKWIDATKTGDEMSQWLIQRVKSNNRMSGLRSWLPSWLQRTQNHYTTASDTGALCFSDTVYLVSYVHQTHQNENVETKASSQTVPMVKTYLTTTGQLTTRISKAATFTIHSVTFEQLITLSSSISSLTSSSSTTTSSSTSSCRRIENKTKENVQDQCNPPANFPLHLLPMIVRSYLQNGLQTVRLLSKEFEETTHSFSIHVQPSYSPINLTEVIAFVSKKCNVIHSLTLKNLESLNDKHIHFLMKHFHENKNMLSKIDFCGCPLLGDAVCKFVILACDSIISIKLACTSITDDGLNMICSSCYQLEHLNLYGCSDITIDGISTSIIHLIESNHLFRSLNLRGTKVQTFDESKQLKNAFQKYNVRVLLGPLKEDNAAFCFKRK